MKNLGTVAEIKKLEIPEVRELRETIQRKTEDLKFSIVKINEKIIVTKYYLDELERAAENDERVLDFVDCKKSVIGELEGHLNKIKDLL